MDGPQTVKSPSSSVGDYLKAIWELSEEGAASTKDVADRLSISSSSVSNMFVRLREMGLAEYERYRGITLTEAGRLEALRLLRRHRLIETFLLECLGYSWDEVHEEAERLEHSVSDVYTERLAEFLGHPEHDPHGDPIPGKDGTLKPDDSFPLAEATAGQRLRVFRVGPEDAPTLAVLEGSGLLPGKVLTVREVRALDGLVTVEGEDGKTHTLGGPLADTVFVRSASGGG
ncbi:MAG: Iron dependent repressor, metal binding and dimerization domain [Rubrobacteraceae bacterium]|jgi:DtxR family Mn-dependent transcriptional regulator|nr:Iron dependent repressor, metal binding and dimerization domain [Rubrobacteraceae bacterium]